MCIFVNGAPHYHIVRLNSNGTYDPSFDPKSVAGGIGVFSFQPDGKLLIGGGFTSIGGTNINNIAHLNGSNTNAAGLQFLSMGLYAGSFLNGIVGNTYRIEWTTDLSKPDLWVPLFDITLKTKPQIIVDPKPPTVKQRFCRAVALP